MAVKQAENLLRKLSALSAGEGMGEETEKATFHKNEKSPTDV